MRDIFDKIRKINRFNDVKNLLDVDIFSGNKYLDDDSNRHNYASAILVEQVWQMSTRNIVRGASRI